MHANGSESEAAGVDLFRLNQLLDFTSFDGNWPLVP
jgi:hypothetical protein